MDSRPQIILTFEMDGKTVHKETKGFIGSECISKTLFIEKALGKAGERTRKSEFFQEKVKDEQEQDRIRG